MKFSIITPTYKRPDGLKKAISSVLNQSYQNFEMIIINDSPDYDYSFIESRLSDQRIKYLKNEINSGVNYSRNRGLDNVSNNSDWIMFLDDDDFLHPDALKTFIELIEKHPKENWFVCNRAKEDGKSLTISPKNNSELNYALDYLILRKFKGDAAHCIKKDIVKNVRFSKRIKQGDEWTFYYELGLKTKFFYHDFNATLTNNYGDLNFRKRSTKEQLNNISLIISESFKKGVIFHLTFILYILIRTVRSFIKH